MGKDTKSDRKPKQASSSARAAEVLANKAAGAGGFGFGGFAGSSPIGPNVPGFGFGAAAAARVAASAAAVSGGAPAASGGSAGGVDYSGGEVPLTAQVDGELAQCIRHLSKKDPMTKTKALQNLRGLIPGYSTGDLVTSLPPWIYMYRRLILDSSRAVRSETAATLACLLTALGKAVAPHLKGLMGPWYLAMHDPYGDAAAASKAAFAAAFPAGRRQRDVVLFCRTELMWYLKDQLAATPQKLGDPRKDSPEELEERHERVQSACLQALAGLIELLTTPEEAAAAAAASEASGGGSGSSADTAGKDELLAAVRDVLCRQGFWKSTTGSKSPAVRRASYGLARVAAQRAPELLTDCTAEMAVCVLGALGEKEPGNHGSMWEAVLLYGKHCPDAWRHVNMRKMLLPRLYSLLRHGCHGSAPTSLPALLPLLAVLPPATLGPGPDVLVTLLESLWMGMEDPSCASRSAKAASLSAYRECLAWGLLNSARLAAPPPVDAAAAAGSATAPPATGGGDATSPTAAAAATAPAAYCRSLLEGTLARQVLSAALRPGAQGEAAAEVVSELVQAVATGADRAPVAAAAPAGEPSIPLGSVKEAVSQFIQGVLARSLEAAVAAGSVADDGATADNLAAACDGTGALLARLRQGVAANPEAAAQVAAAAAQGLMSAGPGGLPPAASQLLATLLREYGTELGPAVAAGAGGVAVGAADESAASAAAFAGAAAAAATGLEAATTSGARVGSFSLDALVASYQSGPVSGHVAEATADLLVAFCHSHGQRHDGSSPALWEDVMAAVLPSPSAAAEPAEQRTLSLQRSHLLLLQLAASVKATAGLGFGSTATIATETAQGWACASLDDAVVRLVTGLYDSGQRSSVIEAAGCQQPHEQAQAMALLSTALGANVAGQVLLCPAAAATVVKSLTGHLAAALYNKADPGISEAAERAVQALRGPLCEGRSGLWRLLPEEACAALAAVAQLGWQSPAVPYSRAGARRRGLRQGDEGGSSEEDSEEDASVDDEDEEDGALSDIDDSEDGGEEGSSGEADGAAGTSTREAKAAAVAARSAAQRLFEDGKPLAAAAVALPSARAGALVRHLAGLLAAVAGGTGGGLLGPRAWSAHAARLLDAAPGGPTQRQVLLDVLLAARSEWRSWNSYTAGPLPSASASTSASTPGGRTGAPAAETSLEYLARLAEAVGPRALLGLSYKGGADGGVEGSSKSQAGGGGVAEAEGAGCPGGRCWVLVELLCSHHAAAAAAEGMSPYKCNEEPEEEEPEEEEEAFDEEAGEETGARSRSRRGVNVSDAWWRAVGRAAEAALGHVVYGTVDEVAAGEDGSGAGGVYGNLLRRLVDELAEGCRGGVAAAEAPSPSAAADPHEDLPPTQAAFLEALCQVVALMQHASPCQEPDGGDSSGPPPLLAHQQRLCRHWLATCRPNSVVSSGLPPQALLHLLPLAAGPVRRAAATAATSEAILAASSLPELSCAWVRHCLSQPAVLVEPSGPAVAALALAVSCFPVPTARGGSSSSGSGAAAAAAALALARSGGAGLAESERPLLMQLVRHQLVRHAGTAAARRQQAVAAAAQTGADANADSTPTCWPQASEAVRAAITRLSHSAVVYYWQGLGQPDWHALLQDVQDHLAGAVAALAACLRQLAAAARAAADGLLQQPPGTTPAGPMALQLLRKLGQRGVLGRVPQGRQLVAECEEALEGCGIGEAAQAAAQLASVLVDLQDEVAAAVGGGTAAGAAAASCEYGNAVSACCSHVMQLAIELGGVECYGAGFGSGAAAAVAAWLGDHRAFWAAVTRAAGRALVPGHEHLGSQAAASAVVAQAAALEEAGLDAAGALLSVALTPGSHLLQPVAYRLLLGGALLGSVTLADAVGAGAAGGGEVELPEYDGDDVAYLTAGGVRPDMAPWLLPSAVGAGGRRSKAEAAAAAGGKGGDGDSGGEVTGNARVYLTAWALLLAHALSLDQSSRGLNVLRQLLREAGHLVYGLLNHVVPELGLQKQQQQQQQGQQGRAGARGAGAAGGTGGAAAAQPADVDGWDLAETLREIGLPSGHHAVRATCRTVYRAVLRALPATARGWFSDLRDRGLATAVESYTAAAEGPALLAAEMASVQALSRRGADDKFTVRAYPSAREVVAVMEVEDGAVLELLVRLPACLPLKAPEVECRRKVGVNETRLRKWLLSIATFLRHQNGSIADAIGLWQRNVASEFEGMEACLICYSVISSVNAQLPRLVCRTCNVRFHPACLYKWFKSAGKSQCPHCQALW